MLRKIFLHDYEFKKKLRKQYQQRAILRKLEEFAHEKADYALYVRPDLWEYDIVEAVSTLAKVNICYQWDGFKRYPGIKKYIPLFDTFYTFDMEDFISSNGNFHFTTNFYFDCFDNAKTRPVYDLFYIGTYVKERMGFIIRLTQHLALIKQSYKFILHVDRHIDISVYEEINKIDTISESLSYKQMIQYIQKSKVIIDIQNNVHNGLSFRAFEAMFFEKKLIANNDDIALYDFYHPDNIFIIKEDNWEELNRFLSIPYHPISQDIKSKYSFTNWIKYVLDIPPYQKIDTPAYKVNF